MRTFRLPAILAAFVLALAAPAAAHHDGTDRTDPPTFRSERVYVKCTNGEKVQTVSMLNGQWPTWNTQAPTQSVASGAGCGHYENLLTVTDGSPNPYDLVWTGFFTGNLRKLAVEAHNIYAGTPRVTRQFAFAVNLFVDGEMVYQSPAGAPHYATPVASSTGASEKLLFTLIGLDGHGFGDEHGDGEIEREVTLLISSYNEYQSAWVWDTTEVPSGLTFNPTANQGLVINAG